MGADLEVGMEPSSPAGIDEGPERASAREEQQPQDTRRRQGFASNSHSTGIQDLPSSHWHDSSCNRHFQEGGTLWTNSLNEKAKAIFRGSVPGWELGGVASSPDSDR